MDKKSFLKGIFAGFVAAVLVLVLARGAVFVAALSGAEPVEAKISRIEQYLEKFYVDDLDKDAMTEMMYTGLVAGVGDPYTNYLSAEDNASFMDETKGSFHGIGVEVTKDSVNNTGVLVVSVFDGSPAAEAGMMPYDRIIEVDEEDVTAMSVNEVVDRVKGEDGSKVKIKVYRESVPGNLDFEVTRGSVEMTTVTSEMLAGNIGYLKISGFKANTYEQFQPAYEALQKQGMKGIIIDVRNNLGGLVDSVESIADYLLPEGTIVYTVDKAGNREDFISDAKAVDIPILLLVNGYSASASEILAGAIQDMGRGTLIGTQTFGKGLVQGLFPMPDGSALKITIQKYYTPKGVCIQGTGIAPDVVVELPEEYQESLAVPRDQDTQLAKAMEVMAEKLGQ